MEVGCVLKTTVSRLHVQRNNLFLYADMVLATGALLATGADIHQSQCCAVR